MIIDSNKVGVTLIKILAIEIVLLIIIFTLLKIL